MNDPLPLLAPDSAVIPDGRCLVVVDLASAMDARAGVVDSAGNDSRILVGVGALTSCPDEHTLSLVRALDLTLVPKGSALADAREVVAVDDMDSVLAALTDAVQANPQASLVLAQLLRWSIDLPVRAALDAESMAYSTLLGGSEFAAWLSSRGERSLPPVVSDPVLVERVGEELRILLNRPERRNAYGTQLRDALVEALAVAESDPALRVSLAGLGSAFCAGGDLDEFGTTPDLVTAHFVRTRAGAAMPLHRLADRVEVRLQGACVGAGIELPAYAGRVVAAPDAWMRLPEIHMGLIPGAGGTVSIPRRIGRWRTLFMALTDAVVPASLALEWGLVDAVDPGDQAARDGDA